MTRHSRLVASTTAVLLSLSASGCGGGPGTGTGATVDDTGFDPARFAATVDHRYFPLPRGASWKYEVTTAEGSLDVLDVAVTDEAKAVMGVDATVLQVTLTVDGDVEENTVSWYAQDDSGAVWLFGEIDEGYERGELVETTSWEAGIDGALPGVVVPGDPTVGEEYRVGFVAGEMEERGRILELGATATVPSGSFDDVLVIENWSDLEPGTSERKHYAPGVGLVMVDSDDPESDIVRMIARSESA